MPGSRSTFRCETRTNYTRGHGRGSRPRQDQRSRCNARSASECSRTRGRYDGYATRGNCASCVRRTFRTGAHGPRDTVHTRCIRRSLRARCDRPCTASNCRRPCRNVRTRDRSDVRALPRRRSESECCKLHTFRCAACSPGTLARCPRSRLRPLPCSSSSGNTRGYSARTARTLAGYAWRGSCAACASGTSRTESRELHIERTARIRRSSCVPRLARNPSSRNSSNARLLGRVDGRARNRTRCLQALSFPWLGRDTELII